MLTIVSVEKLKLRTQIVFNNEYPLNIGYSRKYSLSKI